MNLEVFNYDCENQYTLFDYTMPMIRIDNKIRLIELFAGYGSQAMALNEMGVEFEHYKVVEFDKYAVMSYNAVHDTNFTAMDIKNVNGKDLEVTESNKYTYFLTYSFPCTDLSVAGKMKGMKKGSGTRSGLLWEVERILTEIYEEGGELPQILFMENVPQVISATNIKDFHAWQDFLGSIGYTSHVQTLNAKDYGVAQNRERTFMFSFLGEYNYKFPKSIPLTKTIKDYLENEVEDKYYINTEKANTLLKELVNNAYLNPKANYKPSINKTSYPLTSQDFVRTGFSEISYTLSARDYKDPKNVVVGNINPSRNGLNGNVYGGSLAPTLTTNKGEGQKIIEVGKLNSSQNGIAVDSREISTTLTSGHGNTPNTIVAMRNRNLESPSDGTPGKVTEQRLETNNQDICNANTSVQKNNMVLETVRIKQATKEGFIDCKLGGVVDLSYPTSDTRRGRVQGNGDICPTLTAGDTDICRIESIYRIRKLIPRECGRLMAVTDSDITKILSVVSNSQAYKQFGNSIVVKVMIAMFSNLNIQNLPRWDEMQLD